MATDFGGSPPQGITTNGCATPVSLSFPGIPDVPSEVCTDYVQAIPNMFTVADAVEDVEVRAIAVSQFTIVDGALE